MTRVTKLHDHRDRSLELLIDSSVVTSPVSTELLRAEEEASGEDEGPLRVVVSLEESAIG